METLPKSIDFHPQSDVQLQHVYTTREKYVGFRWICNVRYIDVRSPLFVYFFSSYAFDIAVFKRIDHETSSHPSISIPIFTPTKHKAFTHSFVYPPSVLFLPFAPVLRFGPSKPRRILWLCPQPKMINYQRNKVQKVGNEGWDLQHEVTRSMKMGDENERSLNQLERQEEMSMLKRMRQKIEGRKLGGLGNYANVGKFIANCENERDDTDGFCKKFEKLDIDEEIGDKVKKIGEGQKDVEVIVIDDSSDDDEDKNEVVLVEENRVSGRKKENGYKENRSKCVEVMNGKNMMLGETWWSMKKGGREFSRKREKMTRILLEYFDTMVFEGRLLRSKYGRELVQVGWNRRLYKTAGVTYLKRCEKQEGVRLARIEFSVRVVDEPSRLYQTMAHELAHAANWIFDAVAKPPHGRGFKKWARRFEKFDKRIKVTTCHSYEINYKFSYVCQSCEYVYGRHTKSIDTTKMVCGKCMGVLKMEKNTQRAKDKLSATANVW